MMISRRLLPARALFPRRRWLTAIAGSLCACALAIGPAVAPASAEVPGAAPFSPVFLGYVYLIQFNTQHCLYGGNGDFTAVNTAGCNFLDFAILWARWSTPFGGENLENVGNFQCLDSNAAGDDYTDPCNWNNEYQSWTFGGLGPASTIQNQVTLRCLDGNSSGSSYTSLCNWNNLYQNWTELEGP